MYTFMDFFQKIDCNTTFNLSVSCAGANYTFGKRGTSYA